MRPNRLSLSLTIAWCVLMAAPALATELQLRRVALNQEGEYEIMFALLEDDGSIAPGEWVNGDALALAGGPNPDALTLLTAEGAELERLGDSPLPFRVVLLLPNTDLFNGMAGSPERPDASGLRAAAATALGQLPSRGDIEVYAGVFNTELDWLPGALGSTVAEVAAALTGTDYTAPGGRLMEDALRAIDLGFSGYCRRRRNFFATFLVPVTSTYSVREDDHVSDEMQRARALLEDPSLGHVVTLPVGYVPYVGDEELLGNPTLFMTALTPPHGRYRLANDVAGAQNALSQAVQDIVQAWVLSFSAPGGPQHGATYSFQLSATMPDGSVVQSNVLTTRLMADE